MIDPFATLGLPRRFDVDAADLQKRFVELSAQNHPDRFTDPFEQADAAERSAAINEAQRILVDDEQRANVLLALRGGAAKEEDRSLPPDFLMETMEIRETMEAAVEKGDAAKLAELRAWADDQRGAHLKRIAGLFGESDQPLEAKAAGAIRQELNCLRYVERMLEQMPG